MIHHLNESENIEYLSKLELGMDDDDLILALSKRIRESKKFWNEELELEDKRNLLKDYWKGKHRTNHLYDYQYPQYIDNRFYMHVEHIVQTVNAQPPEPTVTSDRKDELSKRQASRFQEFVQAYALNNRWTDHDRITTRNLLLSFLGVQKIIWDPLAGPLGEDGNPIGNVVIRNVRPENIVIDKNALVFENPAFTAELLHEPLELVLQKFPKKKTEILDHLGMRGVTTQMSAVIPYWEVHFSYLNEDGAPREGVVWFSNNFQMVFDKRRSPDWDEDGYVGPDGKKKYRNMLTRPGKPYAFLNMNNIGEHFIDETSPMEQFLPLQDVLNKRGQQIMDMADEQRGGKIFNKRVVDKQTAARFTNDPGAHLMANGLPQEAFMKVTPDILPPYVLDDKTDARQEGDNIIGVHAPTRGERQGSDQPTTIQLLREGDFQRRGDLINGLDRMNEYKYRYAAHLMKLNYTSEHFEHVIGEDGKKTFIMMNSDEIPSGAVSVKAGTTLPTDQVSQREEAVELMGQGKIDYITFFERLGFPNPQEQAYQLYLHEHNPAELYEAGEDEAEAEQDIEMLKNGLQPAHPDRVSEAYLTKFVEFAKSPEFQDLNGEVRQKATTYIREVMDLARGGQIDTKQVTPEGMPQSPSENPSPQSPEKNPGMLERVRGGLSDTLGRLTGRS